MGEQLDALASQIPPRFTPTPVQRPVFTH